MRDELPCWPAIGMKIAAFLFFVGAAGCPGQSEPAGGGRAPDRSPKKGSNGSHGEGGITLPEKSNLEYLELVTGGAQPEEELPLVVAIHGLGDTPAGFRGLFEGFPTKARVLFPQGPEQYLGGFAWIPPRGTMDETYPTAAENADRVGALIREVRAKNRCSAKTIVTGFSQGGILSFILAVRHPSQVTGSVPVGGHLPQSGWPGARAKGATPPIRALNGAADRLISPLGARQGVVKLRQLGFDAEIRTYERVAHRISKNMRSDLFALIGSMVAGTDPGLYACEPCPRTVDNSGCTICPP